MAEKAGRAMTVDCRITDTKASGPPAGVCARFRDRMAAAYPAARVQAAGTAPADAVLEVTHASARRMMARLVWAGTAPGEEMGTARAGADLDDAAIAAFIDSVIAANPPPERSP